MAKTHNLGYPRIGKNRDLKRSLEAYWNNDIAEQTLNEQVQTLREQHYQTFTHLNFAQAGDFSLYDHVLDTSFLFGNAPARAKRENNNESYLDSYFRIARGRSSKRDCCPTHAGEMTKWFDTNYHYIVPEFSKTTTFKLYADTLLSEVKQLQARGLDVKPVVIGPLTYLYLGKSLDDTNKLDLLDSLLVAYKNLLHTLAENGVKWVQLDEPALVTELNADWLSAYQHAYDTLQNSGVKILLASYFGSLADNLKVVTKLPVDGVHIDATRAKHEVAILAKALNDSQVLSVGIIDGRNIWRTDFTEALTLLNPIAKLKQDKLWLAPSCSLLHCPVDLNAEQNIHPEILPWLAFAEQKLIELEILSKALHTSSQTDQDSVQAALAQNKRAIDQRKQSSLSTNKLVQLALTNIKNEWLHRSDDYATRIAQQQKSLKLPLYPTTTIGSFPQTSQIRKTRQAFIRKEITQQQYEDALKENIAYCIEQQEQVGLDVLVHGEAERNDMVEYFAGHLNGMLTTAYGWVQSYGSRCVKPPIIYGDVSRSNDITVAWTQYAQSLTQKPVKGMLTGPVTILNWSFVRDDQPRSLTTQQIALAVRGEVQALEAAGTGIIQIDEAALREGLPLKQSQWPEYLRWAVDAFKLCSSGVRRDTQIHTHMCYSQFNDILPDIQRMDADVITIETSRSNMKLLDAFNAFNYQNDIGPGVYDIHSPNVPEVESITNLITQAASKIPAQRLWINPDCGLKTRDWAEVRPALTNLVAAAKALRAQ